MTPSELRTIGESIHGPYWQSPLARDLRVNDRTVRRWLAGKSRINPDVAAKIRELHAQHQRKEPNA